jgi:two-component system, OmpR family, response regulator
LQERRCINHACKAGVLGQFLQVNSLVMDASQHILVVDDDPDIRLLLGDYLRKNGFRATTVPDGAAMRKIMARESVDLLVLDIMLRGEDGLSLCRWVRGESNYPVIMLTARGDAVDRIIGLEMGADDYLPKPFNPRELLVRIKSVLRRADRKSSQTVRNDFQQYHFGAWVLDTVSRNLTDANGVVVPLGGAEYRVLIKLLSSQHKVLSRTQLMESGTEREPDPFDRSIDVRISRLRQILGEDAREPKIIKTVYGEGYVLGVDVQTS